MRRVVVLLCLLPWLAHAENITSATCTPAVTTGCFTRNTAGFSSVFVNVSGTWTGSLVFEVAGNAAGPWQSSRAYVPDGNGSYALSVTANGSWSVPTFGAPLLRIRAATLSSGSATVTAQASSFQIPTDIIRAVGPTFGEVLVAGTINANLTETTLTALNPPCSFPSLPPTFNLTTTTVTIDDATVTNRTELSIINEDNNTLVWCCKGASCAPSASGHYPVFPRAVYLFGGIRDSDEIRCRAETGTATVVGVEVSCGG